MQVLPCFVKVIRWFDMMMQVLPCLVEVIRWFDMTMLEDVWDSQLHAESTLLSYGACLAFKYSLEHAGTLQRLLRRPPSTWQVKHNFLMQYLVHELRSQL